jgi:hypothetical protein
MATFVVCLRCGKAHETDGIDQLPKGWQRSHANLFCSNCADTHVLDIEEAGDVLDEEVIYPSDDLVEDTFDDGYCESCSGPCQGH